MSEGLDNKEAYLYGTLFALIQEQLEALEKLASGNIGFWAKNRIPGRGKVIDKFALKIINYKISKGGGHMTTEIYKDIEFIDGDYRVWADITKQQLNIIRDIFDDMIPVQISAESSEASRWMNGGGTILREQVPAADPIDPSEPKYPKADWRKHYEAAFIAIEYRPEVAKAWQRISKVSDNLKEMFLSRLNENPKADVSTIIDPVFAEIERERNPFDDPAMNIAYSKAQKISEEAGREFRRVAERLGDTVDPDDLLSGVRSKFQRDPPEKEKTEQPSKYTKESKFVGFMKHVAVGIYIILVFPFVVFILIVFVAIFFWMFQ